MKKSNEGYLDNNLREVYLDTIDYLEYTNGNYTINYKDGIQEQVSREKGEELLEVLIHENLLDGSKELIDSGLLRVGNDEDLEDIMYMLGEKLPSPTEHPEFHIELSGDSITLVDENQNSTEISKNEAIEILADYAKENNIADAYDLIKTDIIKTNDAQAVEEFNKDLSPMIQERMNLAEEDKKNNKSKLKKVYVYENKDKGNCFIEYTDGTIKELSREEIFQELAKYANENNIRKSNFEEFIEENGLIEEIDQGQAKAFFEQITQTESSNETNIEKFYAYWKINSEGEEELRGIVCYKDGTKKEKSKEEFRADVYSYLEEHNMETEGSIKKLEELGIIETIFEEEAKDILHPQIGKIVFVSYINDDKKIETEAVIYYTDGNVKEATREEAEKEILYIKRANNIKDTEQLFEEKFLECTTMDEFYNNHSDYIEQAKNNKEKYSSISPEQEPKKKKKRGLWRKIKRKLQQSKLVRRIILVTAAIVQLAASGYGVKLVHNSIVGNIKTESNSDDTKNNLVPQENTMVDSTVREDFSGYSYDELIQRCKTNKPRQDAFKTIYNFINDYNLNSAYTYKEEKSSNKLSHTMDEVSAMYLLYNDIDPETVNEIYRTTKFDVTQLKNDLINAQKQDSLAHNLQTRTLNKDHLFIKEDAKKLYNKYDEIFTKMNDTSDYDKKKEYKEKFYDEVRKDLSGMKSNSYENVDSSKVVIKEFVDAMKRVKIDVNNKLTDQEIKYIDGILEHVVDKKINDIVTKQNARNIVSTINFGNGEIIDNNPYYSEFKKVVEKELTDKNAYYTTEDNRDVSDYKNFKKNTKPKQYKKEEAEKKTKATEEKTSSQSASTKETKTNNNPPASTNVTPAQPVSSGSETAETQVVEEEQELKRIKQVDIIEEFDNSELRHDVIEDEINRKPTIDDFVTPDDALEFVDISRVPNDNHIIDTGIDQITPDKINEENEELIPDELKDSEIEFVSPDDAQINNVSTTENIVEFDPNKVDEAGNLSDQYTDISTDLTTTYPTNNSEEIADYLISQMEQDTETYVEEQALVR